MFQTDSKQQTPLQNKSPWCDLTWKTTWCKRERSRGVCVAYFRLGRLSAGPFGYHRRSSVAPPRAHVGSGADEPNRRTESLYRRSNLSIGWSAF
ncbi:hypothetical protein NPIL_416831 [Nephila pilipes]|uniref:Uncharacterized protein n=1 Tax=Nephila pilipes TaxID=299642 RepID=A0A8X6MW92_NEPPI|nr:hypothetical protein NPIL_416831 [Nephila pilipes]